MATGEVEQAIPLLRQFEFANAELYIDAPHSFFLFVFPALCNHIISRVVSSVYILNPILLNLFYFLVLLLYGFISCSLLAAGIFDS